MNSKIRFCLLRRQEWIIFLFVLPLLFAGPARAGNYLKSAHGSSTYGVSRPVMKTAGYARGNCANCHEQHASVGGTTITPSPYTLFAPNFDKSKTYVGPNVYSSESADFCFSCHSSSTTVQVVANNDYSQVFGGAGSGGPADIMAAFNQLSYHNLYDIWTLAKTNFSSWFTDDSNPCNACHNPHLARRNYLAPKQTTVAGALFLSAISRPSNHFSLWGTTTGDTMAGKYYGQYEPPYSDVSNASSLKFEPAGLTDAVTSGQRTPDYVALCTDCHNSTNTIHSTTLGRDLIKIDWSSAGDNHGGYHATSYLTNDITGGTRALKAPYLTNGKQNTTNYVLSCLDCHEPHGSPNITLLRRRVNGGDLAGTITTALPDPPGTDSNNKNGELGYLCMRCHQQDGGTGTGTDPPKWKNVHHCVDGHPYTVNGQCGVCHGPGGGSGGPGGVCGSSSVSRTPIECDKCHFHGGTDAWLGYYYLSKVTNRKTF